MDGLDLTLDSLHFGGFTLKDEDIVDEDVIPHDDEIPVIPFWRKFFCCFDGTWFGSLTPNTFNSNFELLEHDLLGEDLSGVPQNEIECHALTRQESNSLLLDE